MHLGFLYLDFVDQLAERSICVHSGHREVPRIQSPLVQVSVVQAVSRDETLGRDAQSQVDVKARLC